jgi:hypothetical protein
MMQQVEHKNSARKPGREEPHQPVFCEERGAPCCPGWQNSAAPQTANAANPFLLSSEMNSSAVNASHKYRPYVENFFLTEKELPTKSSCALSIRCWKSGSGSGSGSAGTACFLGSLASESSSISQRYGSGSFPFLINV